MICPPHYRAELGESPVWHPMLQRFFWVDITQKNILTLSENGQYIETIALPDKVGCIVVADNGNLIAALARELVEINHATHDIQTICKPDLPHNVMFNDGKVDCEGRLWVGTKDIDESNPIAALYCFDHTGFHLKEENVIISNGTDWNLDNTVMYYTDSPKQTIYQYDFEVQTGNISNKRTFAKVEHGYPDGLTVDKLGRVWGTHWDGSCVTCYSPDGSIHQKVAMECKRPTSCCFGGEDYTQLFITSASIDMAISEQDKNGYVFIDDTLSIGKPSTLFKLG